MTAALQVMICGAAFDRPVNIICYRSATPKKEPLQLRWVGFVDATPALQPLTVPT